MSRKAIVCTILALAMILVGTGYAYWTDTLNVTTKATTGDMAVQFTDLGLYAQYDNELYNPTRNWSIVDGFSGNSGFLPADYFERGLDNVNIIAKDGTIAAYKDQAKYYNNVDFNAEYTNPELIKKSVGPYSSANALGSDQIVLTVQNMYPGFAQAFRTDIINVGSIAAKLSTLKFNVAGLGESELNDATLNMLGLAVLVEEELNKDIPEDTGLFQLCKSSFSTFSANDFFTVGGVEFIRLSALNRVDPYVMQSAVKEAMLYVTPSSENRLDLYLGIAMDPDEEGNFTTGSTAVMAENDDTLSQNKGVQITIDLLWDQFNQGVNVEATNWLDRQNH